MFSIVHSRSSHLLRRPALVLSALLHSSRHVLRSIKKGVELLLPRTVPISHSLFLSRSLPRSDHRHGHHQLGLLPSLRSQSSLPTLLTFVVDVGVSPSSAITVLTVPSLPVLDSLHHHLRLARLHTPRMHARVRAAWNHRFLAAAGLSPLWLPTRVVGWPRVIFDRSRAQPRSRVVAEPP